MTMYACSHAFEEAAARQDGRRVEELVRGREIAVNHVSLAMNGINFEPEEPAKRGTYWVRVSGGGIREAYLVELY